MTDIAALGIKVDSKQAAGAADDLDDLTAAAKRAEIATAGTARGSATAETATQRYAKAVRSTQMQLGNLTTGIQSFARSAVAQLAAVAGATAGFAAMITAARDFDAAMAELSTLLSGNADELDRFASTAQRMAREFGGNASAQVRGFYQAVSAGATSAAQATAIMDSANRVAIGGVTTVATAVDVLTTATNAYARQGLTAGDASDALFVAMRAGKTTIDELAASLGQVIPIAASLNVDFDELAGGVAALTTQGVSTSQAVTGLRAALSAVIKPSSDAALLAKQLGINFSAAALESEGLAGFLDELIRATGGSAEQISRLFGSVEATNAVLSLAGGGAARFASILDDMAAKAGASQEAFDRVSQSLGFRLNRVMAQFGDYALQAGQVILSVMVPALEAIARWLPTIARLAGVVGVALLTAFGPALLMAVRNLAVAIGVTLVASIRALTVAIATNPLGALAVAISAAVAGIYLFRDAIRELTGIDIDGLLSTMSFGLIDSAEASDEFAATLAELDQIIRGMPTVDSLVPPGTVPEIQAAASAFAALRNDLARGIQIEQANLSEALGDVETARAIREEIELIDTIARGNGEISAQQIEYLRQQLEMQREIRREAEVAREIGGIRQDFRTEEEQQRELLARRMEILREGLDMELLTRAEYRELEREAAAEFAEWQFGRLREQYDREQQMAQEQRAFEAQQQQQRFAAFSGFFGNLATAASAGGKKMFAIAKVLNIAQATIDGIAAAVGAYKVGASIGGPPLGAAFAAAATAATGAMIAQIVSADIGAASKGARATNTGGGGLQPEVTAQPAARARDVTLVLQGEVFGRETLLSLIDGLNEVIGDGARIRVA